jgi:hypothetical protein
MQRDTYYIKMTDHNVFKFTDFNLVELHTAINHFCSKLCYYDDDIFLIISESENFKEDLKWDQVPSIEVDKEGKVI